MVLTARSISAETGPTHMGQPSDQGLIVIGDQHEGEGYAVLRCGNTEVRISYTVLHHLEIRVPDIWSTKSSELGALRRAVHSITCEASLGRTGD